MTTHHLHYNGKVIVDIETTSTDIQAVVVIAIYSQFLINNLDKQCTVIKDFDDLQEARGAYFETSAHKYLTPSNFIDNMLKQFCLKYSDLGYFAG